MERLTDETQIGPFAALKDKAEAVPGAFGTYDCLYAHMVAVTRLKEYEDTGLEPEEVSEYQHLCDSYVEAGLDAKFVQFCIDATQNGLSIDRICELAQAEKDGRLVVLPCKLGDTVYIIRGEVIIVAKVEAIHQWISGKWKLSVHTDKRYTHWVGYEVCLDDFGKTVFLTREEAEAALKKMEEDNEAD